MSVTRKERALIGAGLLALAALFVVVAAILTIAGIWGGDARFGWTALVVAVAAIIATIVGGNFRGWDL